MARIEHDSWNRGHFDGRGGLYSMRRGLEVCGPRDVQSYKAGFTAGRAQLRVVRAAQALLSAAVHLAEHEKTRPKDRITHLATTELREAVEDMEKLATRLRKIIGPDIPGKSRPDPRWKRLVSLDPKEWTST